MRGHTAVAGVVALGVAVTMAVAAVPAGAESGGTAAYAYTGKGKVLRVTDGDTFLGDVPAEGSSRARIRLSGVQAMERGECHADEAERLLRQLLPRKTAVTVRARSKSSRVPNKKESEPRPLRLAFNSRGQDVQEELLRAGVVLPNLMRNETINQDKYWVTAQQAASAGVGLWDTDACGVGPSQEAQLTLMVNYNADGNDRQNPNGKYARILNVGTSVVDLGQGFALRTAKHAMFRFPPGTRIQPGGEVILHQGSGADGNGHFYWGNVRASFSGEQAEKPEVGDTFTNPDVSRYKMGGAYLVDRDGDLRAWTLYPCQLNCSNPLQGRVDMNVIYDPDGNENLDPNSEVILLRPIGGTPIDLSYHVLEVGEGEVLEFSAGSVVQPGETMTVHVGRGGASRLHHYLGRDNSILPNFGKGARVVLRTHESQRVTCFAWGATSC